MATSTQRAFEAHGGTQAEFAEAIGTSQQLVSYWLRNSKELPAEFVLPAEKATGISRHDLRPDLYPREDQAA
jgi:DNA-binding transcriptional regulator YdaS (Cro superfamily)